MSNNGDKQKKNGTGGDVLRALGLFTQLGVTMTVCISMGVLGGKFLDRYFGSSPWMLLAGALIGGGAAIKALYDIAMRSQNRKD